MVEYRQDSTTGNHPVYTLEGSPVVVLGPASGAQPAPALVLYPNPAYEALRVDGVRTSVLYQVTTLLGALVQQGTLTPARTIPVQLLLPGLYLLRVQQADQESILRFVN